MYGYQTVDPAMYQAAYQQQQMVGQFPQQQQDAAYYYPQAQAYAQQPQTYAYPQYYSPYEQQDYYGAAQPSQDVALTSHLTDQAGASGGYYYDANAGCYVWYDSSGSTQPIARKQKKKKKCGCC
eukprot:Filipodium_phascolosomae@DN6284_c0_g1_i1.p1